MEEEDTINFKIFGGAVIIAVILTISGLFLMFKTLATINVVLEGIIGDPWYQYHTSNPDSQSSLYFENEYRKIVEALRPIGIICFWLILLIILIGIISNHFKISLLGSYALYLPVLGQFSFAMTALFAGIGVSRIIWLPIYNIEPELLNLAAVVLFPLIIIGNIYLFAMLFLLVLGVFIFIFGVITWIHGKIYQQKIIDFWIYRYSRHPQYLGLILLNYGFLAWPIAGYRIQPSLPSLPWLIVTLILIGLAIVEENNLIKNQKKDSIEQYSTWREKTPFLIPLPNSIKTVILFPIKKVLKKEWPENNKELLIVLILYSIIIILSSLPFMASLTGEMEWLYFLIVPV